MTMTFLSREVTSTNLPEAKGRARLMDLTPCWEVTALGYVVLRARR